MASLVGKIKDKIRNRSDSTSSDRPVADRNTDEHDEQPATAQGSYPPGTVPSHHYSSSPRVSLENSAFHVHRGRKSLDYPTQRPNPPPKDDIPPLPPVPSHTANIDVPSSGTGARAGDVDGAVYSSTENGIPSSSAGPSSPTTKGFRAGGGRFSEEVADELVPERGSSRYAVPPSPDMPKRKAVPAPQQSESPTQNTRLPYRISSRQDPDMVDSLHSTNGDHPNAYDQPDGHSVTIGRTDTGSARPRYLAEGATPSRGPGTPGLRDSAQLASMYLEKSSDTAEKERMLRSGHLHLPEGFSLRDTEETHVYEEVRPAVTHETIIKERTEIVQEEITRDIHVHHYYTYAQPVKVLEILPAKHYYLDLVTGVKTQIPAPKGWELPVNMQPVVPDTSVIKSWTRHYLVDEAHPNGIEEPPPLKHESGHDNLRHAAAMADNA